MKAPKIEKCKNCDGTDFQRIDGIFAVTKVEKNDSGISFMPASGIPIIVYMCTKCGELKFYPAKLFDEI